MKKFLAFALLVLFATTAVAGQNYSDSNLKASGGQTTVTRTNAGQSNVSRPTPVRKIVKFLFR